MRAFRLGSEWRSVFLDDARDSLSSEDGGRTLSN